MIKISENLTNLQDLFLSGCRCITDRGVIKISENLVGLNSLNLSESSLISNEVYETYSKWLWWVNHDDYIEFDLGSYIHKNFQMYGCK